MIKSASQSSLTNDVKYRNLDTFNVPSNEYLIDRVVLSSNTGSVTFSSLGAYAGIYRHLKIIYTAKSSTSLTNIFDARLRFNGDTGTNYDYHYLRGTGTSAQSSTQTTTSSISVANYPSSVTSGLFGSGVIEILDAFSTNKNKTVRSLSGTCNASTFITLGSGLWRSTASLTSIELAEATFGGYGGVFLAGSTVSLYGVTA